MKRILYAGKTFGFFVFLVLPTWAIGQEKINTPAAYESMKSKNQWMRSPNSAGLLLDDPVDYTEISVSYGSYAGDFHRPQEGESGNDLGFSAEGAVFVGQLYAWGKFDYARKTICDANFNSSILDPFRGMPYMVADINKSEWKNQVYDMAFRVATPKLYQRLYLGLELDYQALSGAKQRDPRTENYFYTIRLKPALVFSVNENHHIGAHVDYFNLKEESRMSVVNVYVNQEYYTMYGLGTSVQSIGSGRNTDYKGNNIGGGIQYNYQGVVKLLFSAGYAYKVEDVKAGFSDAREDAGIKEKTWDTNLQLSASRNNLTHFLTLDYSSRNTDGIESITEYDNTVGQSGYVTLHRDIRSTYATRSASMDYDISVDRMREYDWKFGLGAKYIEKKDVYLLPRSEKSSVSLAVQARAKKNVVLPGNNRMRRLLVSTGYTYHNNLSGAYDYHGSHPEYVVVSEFEQIDANFLNANFWSAGVTVVYSQKIKENKPANLFAKAACRYTKATATGFDHRWIWQMTIGCNF